MLYTDGLVERRDRTIHDDIAALARALHGTHTASPDELVRLALSRVLPDLGDDDVAIVALRTGPE